MKNKRFTALLILLLSIFFLPAAISQSREGFHCGTTEALKKLYAKYPQLENDYNKFVKDNTSTQNKIASEKTHVFIIPVVFHVLHQYGEENISDEQIFDAIKVLNQDYRKLNFDTTDIVPDFKSIAADCHIEFRLATKDPGGNCTNGIERIYTHETNIGDDYSKLHQWSRSNYLNIWVVKSMSPGVAGYSYYPTAVAGVMSFADGVIALYDYIGSIGTSNRYNGRTLTHEIGHYLGLSHVWGSTNNPGIDCGDDGIEDTPISIGWQACQLTGNDICIQGTPENVQNYMEYSYCTRMFTNGQAFFMGLTLNNSMASRDFLSNDSNLIYTGAMQTKPLCAPVPEFKPFKPMARVGATVLFNNYTWKAQADAYYWSFPGGTPSSSTSSTPSVVYDSSGWYNVSLTAYNASGSETKTINQCIYIAPSWAEVTGPYTENFENNGLNSWVILNPENNEATWQLTSNGAYQSSKCLMLNNIATSTDEFYFYRLGENTDAFITNSFDLTTTTSARVSFTHSCATRGGTSDEISESLNIYSSTDYGSNWILLKSLKGTELANAGYCNGAYIPKTNTVWTNTSIVLPAGVARKANVRFKFEYIASDLSNNIYIDNIGVEGILGIDGREPLISEVNVYPNPVEENRTLTLSYSALEDCNVEISVCDLIGRELYKSGEKTTAGQHVKEFSASEYNMHKGVYFIRVKTADQLEIKKVIVL